MLVHKVEFHFFYVAPGVVRGLFRSDSTENTLSSNTSTVLKSHLKIWRLQSQIWPLTWFDSMDPATVASCYSQPDPLEAWGDACGPAWCKCTSPIPAVAAAPIPNVAVEARLGWAQPPRRHRLFPSPNRWWVITHSWFIIQAMVLLLQNKHFRWLCPNAKTISQPPLILGFNCFALLSTDAPIPHAWSPLSSPPPSWYGFFPVPTLLMWWATVAISRGPLWSRGKKKIPNTTLFAFRALPPFQ